MKALIVVDTQNDFFEGGALEVPNSNSIIPVVNELIGKFEHVFFTQDWHPENHKSFASQHDGKNAFELTNLNGLEQILWPDHCVQGSKGAEFKAEITFDSAKHVVVQKGADVEVDSYSGFFDNGKRNKTELDELLKSKGINTVYVCGLAADFCVKFTAIDAASLGYRTFLVTDATRAVSPKIQDFGKAMNEMKEKHVYMTKSEEL